MTMRGYTHDLADTGCMVPLPVRYTLGLDLGKLADYTALAIAEERPERVVEHFGQATIDPVWATDPDYTVPWLQRWPLGTPYHAIAVAVGKLVAALVARPAAAVTLFVDATGVGAAVIETLAAEPTIAALGSGLAAVTITAGHETTRGYEGRHRTFHVPKKDLVGAAQMALQRQKLKVAAELPEAETLTGELRTFEVQITQSANATYSHRDGAHDDLVLATALALWGAPQRPAYVSVWDYRNQRWRVPPR